MIVAGWMGMPRSKEAVRSRCLFSISVDDANVELRVDNDGPRYEEGPCQLFGRRNGWGK